MIGGHQHVQLVTVRSNNGDIHENVTEKIDSASFQTILRFSQVTLLLKRRELKLELKRGGCS